MYEVFYSYTINQATLCVRLAISYLRNEKSAFEQKISIKIQSILIVNNLCIVKINISLII